jgi:cell division protein FtsB
MDEEIKVIGGLSKKTKINIFIAVFLIFILISIFSSINQISNIIKKREKIVELEEKLNWERNNSIKLLAEEKSLYNEESIEIEARQQFNMIKGGETNYFVEIIEDDSSTDNLNENSALKQNQENQAFNMENKIYKESDLWGNLRIFYNSEIKKD